MESIKNIFKTGRGPSSSHTMGPIKAAELFKSKNSGANAFRVTLYGSIAATGKGHLTDLALLNTLSPSPAEIVWKPDVFLPFHPNALMFEAIDNQGNAAKSWTVYSIGGGDLAEEDSREIIRHEVYPDTTMEKILAWCNATGKSFWEYVQDYDDADVFDYLNDVWKTMQEAIHEGLEAEGVLPGELHLRRKASEYFTKAKSYTSSLRSRAFIYSYALAVSEQNASGGKIVTAPTCGSSGVLPAVLYHLKTNHEFRDSKIIKSLATAGLIGNIVKNNASIAGADVGCQGEVGVACSMAAAAASQLFGGTINQIEYAAEMGLEHHLGLTCDPVCGLVQVPCIERNAFAAVRALDSCSFANLSDGRHIIHFDKVVRTMAQTGHDLPSLYKETSRGGLAID
ncbi:MAG: L-serine ammonia-lyase [Paludibacter sp.]|jgi:L-serine dehydratase|nr:L-serine ammonia-lyase [Paludibacter sp.]